MEPKQASLSEKGQTQHDLEAEAFPSTHIPLSNDAWLGEMAQQGVSPVIAKAYVAFRQDLPLLLERHEGQWAAYRGAERLGIGPSKTLLYRQFTSQGIDSGDLLVDLIRPEMFDDIGVERTS